MNSIMQAVEQVNNDWVAIASFIVALCAIGLTVWQGYMARQHNKLSIRPAICSGEYHDLIDNKLIFWIKNKGHGTARINEFILSIDNEIVSQDVFEKDLDGLCAKYGKHDVIFSGLNNGSYFEQGEKVNIIEIKFHENISEDIFDIVHERYNLEIKYSSLYGEVLNFNTNEFR